MFRSLLIAAILALPAAPAAAVTNLIANGSFEDGPVGAGPIPGWDKSNVPDGIPSSDKPASVIAYGRGTSYPTGAYGEGVPAPTRPSLSPDAAGTQGLYFVSDYSSGEAITQLTWLGVGNYRLGFEYYLPHNGWTNRNDASFAATIIGVPVVSTAISRDSTAQTWLDKSGVARITRTGYYLTSFVFSAYGQPAKDVVVDRVYAYRTDDAPTTVIPPTPTAVPEPQVWALLLAGFGLTGATLRRRRSPAAAQIQQNNIAKAVHRA